MLCQVKLEEASRHLLLCAGGLLQQEKCLIICDNLSLNVADIFYKQAKKITPEVRFLKITSSNEHGTEPDSLVSDEMLKSNLIVCLTYFSMAHTNARFKSAQKGVKFLSLPMLTEEVLLNKAVLFDYKSQENETRQIARIFSDGKRIQVLSDKGTDLILSVDGRYGNACPGFVNDEYLLGSPPDVEANIPPVETESTGKIVIDGSITCPEIGKLKEEVVLTVSHGKVTKFETKNLEIQNILDNMFGDLHSNRRVLGECGMGLNLLAELTGNMLLDEGAYGCVHFGFGANSTIGGQNKVNFHLDFVMKKPTFIVDKLDVLKEGVFVYEG